MGRIAAYALVGLGIAAVYAKGYEHGWTERAQKRRAHRYYEASWVDPIDGDH